MASLKQGITVAGTLIADLFYEIDSYPKQGYLTTVRAQSHNIGGTGNLILDLAKLDGSLTVKVCALVGRDESGDALREILAGYPNVDTDAVTVCGESSRTLVMNAADTKQRTFFFVPAASDIFCEEYIDWDKADAKIFHLEYLLLMKRVDTPDAEYGTHGARILHDAKERGMMTSIDVVSEQGDRGARVIGAALRYTDICCINEAEAEAATGVVLTEDGQPVPERIPQAIDRLRELGVSKWIVIHTPKCGYGYDCERGEYVTVASLDLPRGYIKGSTGAGDAYCSGVLYGAYRDFSLADSMRLARACAACSLSENNGTDGMRAYDEVMALEQRFGEIKL